MIILLILFFYLISFAITSFIVGIICALLGITFSIKIAIAVWLIIILLRAVF